ncbi:MAG TPA: hypothetical protein VK783_13700 [Bacteroidia bacterium]|jgi:hypothetical protein|nr:hypothetical protein [Bacteroidia bacterium]
MKKTFTLFAFLVFFFSAKSQSLELGGHYFAESNWFFNSNVTNAGGNPWNIQENYAATYSYSYGFHLAYNFNDHISLETNVLWATLGQSYNNAYAAYNGGTVTTGVLPDGEVYTAGETSKATTTVNTIQIPAIFRFMAGNGAYFGLGPQIDLVSNAKYAATYDDGPMTSQTIDVTKNYSGAFFSAVLSFGNNIRISHSFFFNINLRFAYNFTDMKGVDGLGQDLNNNALYSGNNSFYPKYAATNAVSASFGVGLIYRIGHDF